MAIMAPPANVLQTVCRSCRRSLARTISASTQTRHFSASTTRSSSIPKFVETTNEELNTLLTRWRKDVFTPAALSQNHKYLVYKKSRQSLLKNDPGVTVTLSSDEEIKLEPLNLYERPNKRKSLVAITRILGETDDIAVWNNLVKFLEGIHMSNEVVAVDLLEKITRKANMVGRQGIVWQAAQDVKTTGLSLSVRPVTRELFLGIHMRAAEGGFKSEALAKALKDADVLVQMMDRQDHCGGKLPQPQSDWPAERVERYVDMRRDPTVMGVVLELHAAQALDSHNGQDSTGEVTKAANRLLALAAENEANGGVLQRSGLQQVSEKYMEQWIPIAHGVRQALRVNGLAGGQRDAETKLKMNLKGLLDQVDKAIAGEKANLKETKSGRPQRALLMLEKIAE